MKSIKKSLTFDDILIVPAYSNIVPKNVDLKSYLTEKIRLNIPLLSAAMDTVTESGLATALAQEGGIGIIHKNLSIEDQANEVLRVKKFESGVIRDPVTINIDACIADALTLSQEKGISAMPVVKGRDLAGIVTGRDMRFVRDTNASITSVMTPKERLITVDERNIDNRKVIELMHKHRLERILVINQDFELRGMITARDFKKASSHPNASKDSDERLLVGAAVGVGNDNQARITALVEAQADVLVVDTAHGHSQGVLDQIKWIKQHYPDMQVIGGNVATAEAAVALYKAGVDAVKVGIGPGSICTTRIISGVGVPQITAIQSAVEALKKTSVKVIADGGVRYSGDIAKAVAVGADCIMLGSIFAGTDESPGEVEYFQGRAYKSYRGMGSLASMRGPNNSSDRYFQTETELDKLVPEGVEGRVPYKGPVSPIIAQLCGGLRSSMGYCGTADIRSFQNNATIVEISSAAFNESHVHDVTITKQAPNYRV